MIFQMTYNIILKFSRKTFELLLVLQSLNLSLLVEVCLKNSNTVAALLVMLQLYCFIFGSTVLLLTFSNNEMLHVKV